MQENNHIQHTERDQFDELISNKLKEHRLPVSEGRWEEIEKAITPRRQIIRWWHVASAAAVIGLIVLFIFPLKETDRSDLAAEAPTSSIKEEMTFESESDKELLAEDLSTETITSKKTKTKSNIQMPFTEIPKSQKAEETKIDDSMISEETVISEQTETTSQEEQKIQTEERKEEKKKESDVSPRAPKKALFPKNKPLVAKSRDYSEGWSIGVSAGTGGGISLELGSNDFDLNNELPGIGSGGESSFYPNNIYRQAWDYSHKMPISVGFMIKKQLSRVFGLETGLMYTYLYSDLERYGSISKEIWNKQSGSQQLHYLGVPVNLVANFWRNKNWTLYASAGAMLEKGISMKHKIHYYENGVRLETSTTTQNWLHGSQWSLNGAIGVSFNLTQAWSIYLEPRVSHFFDNAQPASIRTENRTLFNLSGGIKFNL